jgi:acid phosphatase family membrane protein YuiD
MVKAGIHSVEMSITMGNGLMTREMGLGYIPFLVVFTTARGVRDADKVRAVLNSLMAPNSRGASKTMNLFEDSSNIQTGMSTQGKCETTSALGRKDLIWNPPLR